MGRNVTKSISQKRTLNGQVVSELRRREKDEPSSLGDRSQGGGTQRGAPSSRTSSGTLGKTLQGLGVLCGEVGAMNGATETRSLLVPTSELSSLSSSLCAVLFGEGTGPCGSHRFFARWLRQALPIGDSHARRGAGRSLLPVRGF